MRQSFFPILYTYIHAEYYKHLILNVPFEEQNIWTNATMVNFNLNFYRHLKLLTVNFRFFKN